MRLRVLASALVILACASVASAWSGKVVGISDGDTIKVLTAANEQVRIRLYGIDTPEKAQSFGEKAKQAMAGMVFGKSVEVQTVDTDRYGRTVARVSCDGVDVGGEMVKAGMAWVYRQYCREDVCSQWLAWENDARSSGRGLWVEAGPTPPWEWRHGGANSGQQAVAAGGDFHGNTNSRVFHRPGCRWYNCKNCTAVFSTREEAIKAGYRPCKVCRP